MSVASGDKLLIQYGQLRKARRNPYLYDGKDGVRFDVETGLYWMSVRAYDPTLGRFISRDPLGRAPLMGWNDQRYIHTR